MFFYRFGVYDCFHQSLQIQMSTVYYTPSHKSSSTQKKQHQLIWAASKLAILILGITCLPKNKSISRSTLKFDAPMNTTHLDGDVMSRSKKTEKNYQNVQPDDGLQALQDGL